MVELNNKTPADDNEKCILCDMYLYSTIYIIVLRYHVRIMSNKQPHKRNNNHQHFLYEIPYLQLVRLTVAAINRTAK